MHEDQGDGNEGIGDENGKGIADWQIVAKTERLSYSDGISHAVRVSDVFVLVLQLRRLEHARDAHRRLALFLRLALRLRLLLFQEEVGVVSGELLELDEEVAQRELEPVDVAVELAQAHDERLYLRTVPVRSMSVRLERRD